MSRWARPPISGFTLIELILVIVVMAIAALMAVPMLGSAGPSKLGSAARMVAADLQYARDLAVTYGSNYAVQFDTSASPQYYQILDRTGQVIRHPVTKSDYSVVFSGTALDGVVLADVDLDGTSKVSFDGLGSPFNGTGQPLNKGVIRLEMNGFSQAVIIEPVTGYIRAE